MNILVTGSNGQLGCELRELAKSYGQFVFVFTDKPELDITSEQALKKFFKQNKIDCVINCAGFTAVDGAEDDIAGAKELNTRGAGLLASACTEAGALIIHISTDYVFDGQVGCRPYRESDVARPRSVYGKSKLEGELEMLFNAQRSLIIRTSWLYSSFGHNFVKTILNKAKTEQELRVVYDQIGAPTYAADLAKTILDMLPDIPPKIRGKIYNYSNEGVCSWYDFAHAIIEMEGLQCHLKPVLTAEFKQRAQRPHYSVLDKTAIKTDYLIDIPHWRDGLRRCLEAMRG
ncbi:MAG: dTDP-4-dehydrorhamnose reductase [Bacteroidia bacterium]|nr:MAG: dTDP-4-dehydrorhamnose reductase [Bacteroidia bacterium]